MAEQQPEVFEEEGGEEKQQQGTRKGKGFRNALGEPAQRPDAKEFQAKTDECQQQLHILFKELNDLKEKMDIYMQSNSEYSRKRDILRQSLDSVQSTLDKLESERSHLMSEMEGIAKQGRDMRTRAQGLRRALGFQSNDDLDSRIRDLERQRLSRRMNVHEENRLIAQIEHLKQSRPLMSQYASMELDADGHIESSIGPLRAKIEEIREQLREAQQRKRTLNEQLSQLNQERSKAQAPLRELSDRKDTIRKQIVEQRRLINQLRDDYYKKEREFEAYQAKLSRAQDQQKAQERRIKALERERENLINALEDMDAEAWSPEIQTLHQVVVYLRKLAEKMPQTQPGTGPNSGSGLEASKLEVVKAVDEEEEADTTASPASGSKGRFKRNAGGDSDEIILKPKNRRDDDDNLSIPRNKKIARKMKRAAVVSMRQPLVHDLGTLSDFQKLNVSAPLTLEDCPQLLAKLEDRLNAVKEKTRQLQNITRKQKAEIMARLEAINASGELIATVPAVKSY